VQQAGPDPCCIAPGRPLSELDPFALYAAQATEVLLDAIARSNGTRASVASELLGTRVNDGLIGSFGFDRHGNPTPAPITILRIDFSAFERLVGATMLPVVLDRVLTPPPRLFE